MIQWQPIDTAPKGSSVLIFCSHGQYVAYYPGSDHNEHGYSPFDIEWWHVDDNKHGPYPLRGSDPTHWMPLPAPPTEASKE